MPNPSKPQVEENQPENESALSTAVAYPEAEGSDSD
jgi:hypothetical protein